MYPMGLSEIFRKIAEESHRVEEDTGHSAKGHFNASDRWGRYHLIIGLSSAIIAAIAGGSAFNSLPELAGGAALLSTALTTVLTFLKPSERSELHKTAGDQYLSLKNRARIFREIELLAINEPRTANERIMALAEERDELNRSSPGIPRRDYALAKKDIDEGRAQHEIDRSGK